MATTTNYGWTTPDDTSLVKDGASAIRTLGSSIDTTLKAQIDAQIPDTLLTTTGDVIYASAANTPARLGVGTTGQVLTVAGGVPSWAAAGGALALSTIASGSLNTGTSLTLSSLSSYDTLILVLNGITWATGSSRITVLVNNDSAGNYIQVGGSHTGDTVYPLRNLAGTSINTGFGRAQDNASASNTHAIALTNCKGVGFTNVKVDGTYVSSGVDTLSTGQFVYKSAAAVSSLVISTLNSYTFNGTGTYQLIGA
jgi:hypothetical protein